MQKPRPISPHLQIYKVQLTSLLSILHRICGAFLALGAGVFTYVLWSIAEGPAAFDVVCHFATWSFVQVILAAFLFAYLYHFLNGIRHLSWDFGMGYNLKTVYLTGTLTVVLSLTFSCIFWVFVTGGR